MTKGPIEKNTDGNLNSPPKNPKREDEERNKRGQDDDVEYIPPRRPHEYINPTAEEDEIGNKDDIEGSWNPGEEEENNDDDASLDDEPAMKVNKDTALDTNDSDRDHHDTENLKK